MRLWEIAINHKKKKKKSKGSKKKNKDKDKEKGKGKGKGKEKVDVTKPPRGILIAACQSYQESYYGKVDASDTKSLVVSYFTHVFLELLYQTNNNMTLEDLIVKVNRRLSRTIWRESPLKQRAGLYCNPDQANQLFLGGMVV